MSSQSKPEPPTTTSEQLVTTFKRRGHFDTLRKSTLSSFQNSTAGQRLVTRLREIVRAEVEKDSNLLHRDRSKSSILIGGAVDRSGVLDNIQRERDTVFEEQHVRDDIKAVISAVLKEASGTDASKGTT